MDIEAIKERHRAIWALGDYSLLSEQLEPAARELCDACAVSAGQEVLDVAAGDGNFALACAAEGASVVASDLSPGMVERGRERSRREGYDIDWVEADAEALPFEDARFDCVGSVFGAMIAPRPEVVASELFRVVRPGNTVGMTAWTPGSFSAELFAVGRRYLPSPPGMPVSEEWGREETVRERFGPLASHVECERHTLLWTSPSRDALTKVLSDGAPTAVAARRSLPADRFEAMLGEQLEVADRFNRAEDGAVEIEAEYLLTVARKRG
jgi:ubiquinone/menaquinone biosynthesis C-methylase UbiE